MEHLPTPIELKVPGNHKMLRLARLTAGGVADACGLLPDEAEDFKLLTGEICGALIEASTGSEVRVEFRIGDGALTVEGCTHVQQESVFDTRQAALSHQVLDALADAHELIRYGDRLTLLATVRRRAQGIG